MIAVGVLFLLLLFAVIAHVGSNAGLSRNALRALRWVTATELALLIALASIGAIYEYRSRTRDHRDFPPPGKLVDLGGYRLHIQCAGPGSKPDTPTIVLDSGLVGSVLDWRRVLPELARFTRVCAYDRGGYGWSDPSPRPRTPDGITTDLHALLEKSGEQPPYVLVGHSLGGLNMWAYANRYSDEVAGLVLVDSAYPQQLFPFPWQERARLLLVRWLLPFGLPRWRGWCGSTGRSRSEKTAIACQPRYQRHYYEQRETMPQYMAEARKLSPPGSLPVILISRDPQKPEAQADTELRWQNWQQDLRHTFSNSRSVIAEGSGHDIPDERPDIVVRAIRDVLQQLQHSQVPKKD